MTAHSKSGSNSTALQPASTAAVNNCPQEQHQASTAVASATAQHSTQ